MPRVPSEVEGVAVEFDPRANAWRIRFDDRVVSVREWTWGERRRLVLMAADRGRIDGDLFLDGLFETVADGSIPREEAGRIPLAVAVLRILGLGRASKVRPLAAGELLVTRSFGWPPDVLDRQPAGSIDRLCTQLEAASPTPTAASDAEPGWNRILVAPRSDATASLPLETLVPSGAASRTPAEELAAMMESVAAWAGLAVGTSSDLGANDRVARSAMDREPAPVRPTKARPVDDPAAPSRTTSPETPTSTTADAITGRTSGRRSTETETGVLPGRARLVAWPREAVTEGKPARSTGRESGARPSSKLSPGRPGSSGLTGSQTAPPAPIDRESLEVAGIGTGAEAGSTVSSHLASDLAFPSHPRVAGAATVLVDRPSRESVSIAGPAGPPRKAAPSVGWDRNSVAIPVGGSVRAHDPGEGSVTASTGPRERRPQVEGPVAGRSPVAHERVPMPERADASAGLGRWSWPQGDARAELATAGPLSEVGTPEVGTAEGGPFETSELEERLADVLERAASEAGIDLP